MVTKEPALPQRAKRAISRPLPNGFACTIAFASSPLVGARVRPLPQGDTAPIVKVPPPTVDHGSLARMLSVLLTKRASVGTPRWPAAAYVTTTV